MLDKFDLLRVNGLDAFRFVLSLVSRQTVLIAVVPAVGDELERLFEGVASGATKGVFFRMWRGRPPWIVLSINKCQPWEAERESADLVHFFNVGVCRKCIDFARWESLPAYFSAVLGCDEARDLEKRSSHCVLCKG